MEEDPLNLQGGGPPQQRVFRNSQQVPPTTSPASHHLSLTPLHLPQPQPQYQAPYGQQAAYSQRDLAGYSFQNINGQYINTGK